jgi:hypothetical protein
VEQLSYGSSKRKKEFLFLACCENVPLPEGKDDDDSEGEENKTVSPVTTSFISQNDVKIS